MTRRVEGGCAGPDHAWLSAAGAGGRGRNACGPPSFGRCPPVGRILIRSSRGRRGSSLRQEVSIPETWSPLATLLFRFFRAMNCGAILLDGGKRILRLNGLARKRLGEAVSTHNGCLCATDRTCDATFQTILDQSLERRRPERARRREAIGLKRAERRPVVARVIPVAGEVQELLEGAELIVILLDPEDRPELPHGLLQQVFGLTKGE